MSIARTATLAVTKQWSWPPRPPAPPPQPGLVRAAFFSDPHVDADGSVAANQAARAAMNQTGRDFSGFVGDMAQGLNQTMIDRFHGIYGDLRDTGPAVIRPSTGNHDINTGPRRDMFASYWWDLDPLWYSFDLPNGWHGVSLSVAANGTPHTPLEPQFEWAAADLAAHRTQPTFLFWHHPRFNRGSAYQSSPLTSPVWELFPGNPQVEFVVSGHEHIYQRFHRILQNPSNPAAIAAIRDDADGVVQFICPSSGSGRSRSISAATFLAAHGTGNSLGFIAVNLYPDRWESLAVGIPGTDWGPGIGGDASQWHVQPVRVSSPQSRTEA